jgi:hypothetical protein
VANEWREHPQLQGRFHPEYPDDLQVYVHDGGPRLSPHPAEAVWVTVTAVDGDTFRGRVLNQPHNLTSVKLGDEVRFMVAAGARHPVMVTDKYRRERPAWAITACNKCGFSELFDAPSDLIRVVFPNQPGGQMVAFTAFCPLCGGVQLVKAADAEKAEKAAAPAKRPWWRFWG